MIETIETISTETVNRADEKTPEWVGMTVNGVLYYVNTEKKVWIKSADTIPYPRAYYPGIENECDYADLEPLWNYFGEEEEEESEKEEENEDKDEDEDEDKDEEEEEEEWNELIVKGVLYYVNPEETYWIKSNDMYNNPRSYYPGIENDFDYEDLEPVWDYDEKIKQ